MSAVRQADPPAPAPEGATAAGARGPRGVPWALGLGAILAVAFALRVWGAKHGLPFVYNNDENAHFVPRAIGMFGHDLNPRYFLNPPAYTYLLHLVYVVAYGGREAVGTAYATNATEVFLIARVTAAILGTAAVWLLALAAARLFDRRVGLLSAGLMAVAFLPVFYGHLALNDVPTLAPLTLSLLGTAGVLRRGRPLDYVLAGAGLGLAAATKYTGGIALLPLLAAVALRARDDERLRPAFLGLLGAGALAVACFVIANPYVVLDPGQFWEGVRQQSSASAEDTGKLGLTQDSGILYYLWTLTWGLGWVPALAAVAGAALLVLRDRRLALVLVPAPIVFLIFMGVQERYFGRWLLPVFPFVIVLAAYAAFAAVDALGPRVPRFARAALVPLAAALLLAQGVVTAVHADRALTRDDTRALARAWMVRNVPAGTKVVLEPIVPEQWLMDPGRPSTATASGNRWIKFLTGRTLLGVSEAQRRRNQGRTIQVEDYERIVRPGLIGAYERGGYCWVMIGSTQYGRAFADPGAVPAAIAYYRALGRRGKVVFRASPYRPGAGPVPFSFDWSFNSYPLAFARPGPNVIVYRLSGGRCA